MKEKTVFFRVDMNSIIATGHMMRCLAIADALRSTGNKVVFILADDDAGCLLHKRGYKFEVLNTHWNQMEEELPLIYNMGLDKRAHCIIVDSYYVTTKYLFELSKLTKVIYIDDYNRKDLEVHTIIAYSVYACKEIYESYYDKTQTRLLIGPQYAPLRDAFQNIGPTEIKKRISNVLILSGGTDPYNTIEQCLEALNWKNTIEIHAICGKYSERVEGLKTKYIQWPNIYVHKAVNDIEKYMINADICISAAGTTLYELCACGTPTFSYVLADNQIENALSFSNKGIIPCLGDVRKENIKKYISKKMTEYAGADIRRIQSEKMRMLVDGKGCDRIIKEII